MEDLLVVTQVQVGSIRTFLLHNALLKCSYKFWLHIAGCIETLPTARTPRVSLTRSASSRFTVAYEKLWMDCHALTLFYIRMFRIAGSTVATSSLPLPLMSPICNIIGSFVIYGHGHFAHWWRHRKWATTTEALPTYNSKRSPAMMIAILCNTWGVSHHC